MHSQLTPGTPLRGSADLTTCDREVIHSPAKVQTFGCVVGVRLSDQRFVSCSVNVDEWLPGLLFLRLGQRVGGALLFFRAPYINSVNWAGDPEKNEADDSGLSPLKSFAKFTQLVHDKSLPWSAIDRITAETLQSALNSIVVEQAAQVRRANDELRQLNADLDAFVYAASHDLKEPLRGIRHHVFMLEQAGDLAGPAYDRGLTSLKRLVGRMSELLDGLLRFSRAGRQELRWESFPLSDVVDQARDVAFGGRPPHEVEINVAEDGNLSGDFACVREVLSNLITDAVKYNKQPVERIEISCLNVIHTPLARNLEYQRNVISVRDNELLELAFERIEQPLQIERFVRGEGLLARIRCEEGKLPRLIYVDLPMPGIGGMETLKALKEISDFELIPRLVFSTSTNPPEIVDVYRIGASAFRIKIVETPDMLTLLERTFQYWIKTVKLAPMWTDRFSARSTSSD